MNFYEAVFIVRQEVSTAHVESVAQEMVQLIESLGGEVTKTELCGLRTLAYPINKSKKGYYVLFNIANPNNNIQELEKKFRMHEDVIRFMIVKVKKLENTPSALMRRGNENKDYKGE